MSPKFLIPFCLSLSNSDGYLAGNDLENVSEWFELSAYVLYSPQEDMISWLVVNLLSRFHGVLLYLFKQLSWHFDLNVWCDTCMPVMILVMQALRPGDYFIQSCRPDATMGQRCIVPRILHFFINLFISFQNKTIQKEDSKQSASGEVIKKK